MVFDSANSVDPDEMPRLVLFRLGLRCLPKISLYSWVKMHAIIQLCEYKWWDLRLDGISWSYLCAFCLRIDACWSAALDFA